VKSSLITAVLGLVSCWVLAFCAVASEPPPTGPETEKRFPSLKVPAGLKATLFACDPLIAYPSAIALGPRPRSLFVAVDYLSGLGQQMMRRDEIRLIEDTDGDGYADRAVVHASGLNSVQGLAYCDGTLYVMHAPFLSALHDHDGDGVAEMRRDLLSGLGLPPERNPALLHCANGIVSSHDGWLYLALGDRGCDVVRPEGDRLKLRGGGILRCRSDGRDLHVFASGLRNIYDVALDEDMNVFVRDNENDGGDYKIRLYHSFFGADHGYPYLYAEHPAEALAPLADLGLGSSAGGLCYLETGLPAQFRGDLFFCEWGRAVMSARPLPAGSGFGPLKEIEFAAGHAADPYGFKPTDLVVDRDGSLIVADWADGQTPKRGRGRIYRIAPAEGARALRGAVVPAAGVAGWIAQLDSESYFARQGAQAALERLGADGMAALREAIRSGRLGVRGRLHAIWALARAGGPSVVDELLELVRTDADPRIQAQALRAVGDLADPVLVQHRLDAGPGEAALAERLAQLAEGRDPRVVREVVVAVGRLAWPAAPSWLRSIVQNPDAPLAHAAMRTMRRSANWPAILALLDQPDSAPLRPVALRAIADRAVPALVDGVIERLRVEPDPARRRAYAEILARVYKKPGPAPYWGYRPAPRPANTVAWARTDAIAQALDRVLSDQDRDVRLAVLRRTRREQVPIRPASLARWLREDDDATRGAAILESLRDLPASQARELTPDVVAKLNSPAPELRSAALETLIALHAADAGEAVALLLRDREARVRCAAVAAVSALGVRAAVGTLLDLAGDSDPGVRRAALDALRVFREPRALPLALSALADRDTEATALQCVGELGGPDQFRPVVDVARRQPSALVLPLTVRLLSNWAKSPGLPPERRADLKRALAELQGASGTLTAWQVAGPLPEAVATPLVRTVALPGQSPAPLAGIGSDWRTLLATGTESPVQLGSSNDSDGTVAWLALTDVAVPDVTAGQFLVGGEAAVHIWLNGQRIFECASTPPGTPSPRQVEAALVKGTNRVLVEIITSKHTARFHLRFRRKASSVDRERLMQAALTSSGDAARGRRLFLTAEKSQCLTCHRIGDQGERIGPELTGVGARFSRIFIVESILEPSRSIAPSFETLMIGLKDGRVLTGVRTAETELTLTLADQQGQKHVVSKSSIDEQRPQAQSTMPEGLEKRLTPAEFIDLIEFLASQR
jgi:putative membrane-bound dehydrogenase-like protein